MGFDDLVRDGIALATTLTSDLQDNVVLSRWTGVDGYNKPTYADPVTHPALIENKQRQIRLPGGEVIQSRTKVTFLHPMTAHGAAKRKEPLDPRDKIVLPDGRTGPILDVKGLIDPSTGFPYMIEVFLG
jgi:hypothetical protein